MKTQLTRISTLLLFLVVVTAGYAEAGIITTDPGTGVTTTFTATGNNGFGNPGPVVVNGITITGSPQVTYGSASYGLSGNGRWTQLRWVATNNGTGTVTFDLGGLASFVGGFVNYVPGSGSNATIEALGVGLNVLESYDLTAVAPISTPNAFNAGAFRGIERAGGDIAYFRIGGNFILTNSLTIGSAVAVVPEPASLAIFGIAAVGVVAGGIRRRRFRAVSTE